MSRFNYEEDQYGKKISPDSPDYRSREKRKTTLPLLFDMENQRTNGSLRDFGVEYMQSDLLADGSFDFARIEAVLKEHKDRIKVVFIQRSKGYATRKTFSVSEIGELIAFIKSIKPNAQINIATCWSEKIDRDYPWNCK